MDVRVVVEVVDGGGSRRDSVSDLLGGEQARGSWGGCIDLDDRLAVRGRGRGTSKRVVDRSCLSLGDWRWRVRAPGRTVVFHFDATERVIVLNEMLR